MVAKKKLLIVDDEIESCAVLSQFFQDRYEVEVAYDGKSALEMISTFDPDCILLDIRMPTLNGWEVLKSLKESGARNRVIVIAGSMSPNFEEEHLQLGAFACLPKPLDLDLLTEKVERALEY